MMKRCAAALFVMTLMGCASTPTPIPKAATGYKNLKLALVLKQAGGDVVSDEMVAVLTPYFASVTVASTREEARKLAADLVVELTVHAELAKSVFHTPRIDVRASFTATDGRVIDTLNATARKIPSFNFAPPKRFIEELNMETVKLARRDLEGKLLSSVALGDFSRSRGPGAAPSAAVFSGQSEVDRPSYRLAEKLDALAVVVGIERYKDIASARFAERDAEAVGAHMLAAGLPPRNIIMLRGESATLGSLRGYLEEWLPRNVRPQSTLFFYFSGHGAPDPKTGDAYLVPWDGNPMFLHSSSYPLKRLYAQLQSLPARRVMVVMDACFSGAGGRSVLAQGARPLVIRVDAPGPEGRLTVLAAAAGDEITSTRDDQGHGTFTYHLLRGLSGGAQDASGVVTARGLFEYLRPQVQDDARRQNREQTPVLQGIADSEIVRFR